MNAKIEWLSPASDEEARAIAGALSPEEEAHAEARTDAMRQRERECRALQAAWEERAAIHEALTKAGVPAGDAADRVRWLIRQWRKEDSGGL